MQFCLNNGSCQAEKNLFCKSSICLCEINQVWNGFICGLFIYYFFKKTMPICFESNFIANSSSLKTYGESCNSVNDCDTDLNLNCIDSKCSCISSIYYWSSFIGCGLNIYFRYPSFYFRLKFTILIKIFIEIMKSYAQMI